MIKFVREAHLRESSILEEVCDHEILEIAFKNGAYLAGGAIRSVFTGERIEDLDIMFESEAAFKACTALLAENVDEDGRFRYNFTQTDAAWSYKPDGGLMIQLIKAVYGEPERVLAQYDFTMCMGAWIPGTQRFVFADCFLKHCAQRRLVYNTAGKYPISSLWRTLKYVKRGYKLPGVEAIKLALRINSLRLDTVAALKEQLMGIDTLFLKEFTDKLAENQADVYDFGTAVRWLEDYMDKQHAGVFSGEEAK